MNEINFKMMNYLNKINIKTYIGKISFALLGIPTWGVGSMPPNVVAKLEKDNGLAYLIQANKISYTKGLKDV
jgi:hypothetical protein